MEKLELITPFKEFEIEDEIFTVDLSDDAVKLRGEAFGEIYDDILWAENIEDILLLYEKAVTALFGKDGFNDLYSLCKKNLYVLSDIVLKISKILNQEEI